MKKYLAMLLALTLGCSLLAGCSDATGDEEQATTTTTTTTETTTDTAESTPESTSVTIGLYAPLTGTQAEYGQQFQIAAELVQEEINANGGVGGKTLELVIMDSKGDAKEACDIARILVDNEDVIGVIGDFASTTSMAAAPIYQEAGLVMCSPSGSHTDLPPMGDYIFAAPGMQADESIFAAKAVKEFHGLDSTAILWLNNDWGVLAEEYFKEGADLCGLEVTGSASFMSGEADFKTVLAKMRQTEPESLTLLGNYSELASITKQVKDSGWDVPIIISGSSCTSQYIELAGEAGEGVLSETTFFFEEDNASQMAFYDAFEAKAGFAPTVFAGLVHDTLSMFCAAIEAEGATDRASFRDAIASYDQYSGIMGPLVFNEDGAAVRDYRIAKVTNGAWDPISDYGALN